MAGKSSESEKSLPVFLIVDLRLSDMLQVSCDHLSAVGFVNRSLLVSLVC